MLINRVRLLLLTLLVGDTFIYFVVSIWAARRLYTAAWAEIKAGRWTPPQKAKALRS